MLRWGTWNCVALCCDVLCVLLCVVVVFQIIVTTCFCVCVFRVALMLNHVCTNVCCAYAGMSDVCQFVLPCFMLPHFVLPRVVPPCCHRCVVCAYVVIPAMWCCVVLCCFDSNMSCCVATVLVTVGCWLCVWLFICKIVSVCVLCFVLCVCCLVIVLLCMFIVYVMIVVFVCMCYCAFIASHVFLLFLMFRMLCIMRIVYV